ncbi:MAG: recombination mediator RecR [Patescibacteria group bacterium]|nr:recombination mediator RecR [Patescibacteria group bacterium]
MYKLPKAISKLIEEFSKLPGIGPKTASRLTFYLIKNPNIDIGALGEAVLGLRGDLEYCSMCHNITDQNPCAICSDNSRDKKTLCVVEEPIDVMTIERSNSYNGLYHVLGGRLSPLEGVTAEDLQFESLLKRVKAEDISEIIVATNHNIEGETTALYIEKLLNGSSVKLSRIASGLPAGSDLEYADEVTLVRAFEGRRQL